MNISERGVLVLLRIRQWGATQQDSEASAVVAEKYEAHKTAGAYVKKLADSYLFNDFTQLANAARGYHLTHTLPWMDGGWRICPNTRIMEYLEQMRKFVSEAETIAGKIADRREMLLSSARQRLGKMFHEDDFPTAEELKRKFRIDVDLMAVPNVKDFRIELGKEAEEVVRKEIEEQIEERNNAMLRDLWQRLYKTVEHMHDRLKGEDRKRFRTSMLDNVREVASLLPALNIMGDPELDNMARAVREQLCVTDVETLRSTPEKRREVAEAANNILDDMRAKMGAFMGAGAAETASEAKKGAGRGKKKAA